MNAAPSSETWHKNVRFGMSSTEPPTTTAVPTTTEDPPRGRSTKPRPVNDAYDPQNIGVRFGPVMTEKQFKEYRKNNPNVRVVK